MRLISNEDLHGLIKMPEVVDVLRDAYQDLARNELAYIPLISLFAPTPRDDDYYRTSTTIGSSARFGVAAIRIKSDIVSWPANSKETKYALKPGTFCGLILLFSLENASPLAIIQDGIVQHMRVGASAAIGVDLMARRDATTLGMLGSGGMARSSLEAISHVRDLSSVNVFSPTRGNLERYCSEMSDSLGIDVNPALSAEDAVRESDIVVTATNSLTPTIKAEWLSPGSHVTCVQRRELEDAVYQRASLIAQLGHSSMPSAAAIPGIQRVKGGFSAYIAGTPEQQQRIPRGSDRSQNYPTLSQIIRSGTAAERSAEDISLFLPIGTNGVQFAAVGGHALSICEASDLGRVLPTEWFLENIRN